jgi:CRISPR-associated protein Csd1
LELDTGCHDRDYLYGRLLALADKIESHARFLQVGKDDTEKRPTNAVRYMSAFAAKPFSTWPIIYKQLNPYIQRLNGAEGYQRQIDEIIGLCDFNEFTRDKSLNGKYLIGYSLQRRALNQKNKEEKTENELGKEN